MLILSLYGATQPQQFFGKGKKIIQTESWSDFATKWSEFKASEQAIQFLLIKLLAYNIKVNITNPIGCDQQNDISTK